MKIIGILLLIAGIGIGITEKEYGSMALGIVLGAFLIWYSPKFKEKSEIKKKEKQEKRFKKMIENMSDEELNEYSDKLDKIESSLNDIDDSLNDIGEDLINNEKVKKD